MVVRSRGLRTIPGAWFTETLQRASVCGLVCLFFVALSGHAAAADTPPSPEQQKFRDDIEPILRKRCYSCHSHTAAELKGGLTLDWKQGWLTGGGRGPAIVPGDVDKSLLARAIQRTDEDLQMPPAAPLPAEEKEVLLRWIASGAADPRVVQPAAGPKADPNDWWSLRPLRKPVAPEGTAVQPIDRFIDSALSTKGLTRSPAASRRDLIRRLNYDLTGLPPTPEEVASFVADTSPDAYEKLVDRLLASPRYGERWARHWLDAVHFADTHGFEHDIARDNAWRYRDYVIAALNRDVPWARFIREQLAADAFYPDSPELIPALGFLGAGPFDLSTYSTAPVTFDYLERDDIVTQTMAAFASTTANCARCHAHKFDPISQEDYYALQAVFAGVLRGDVAFDADPEIHRSRVRWTQLLAAAESRDKSTLLSDENRPRITAWIQSFQPARWNPLKLTSFVSSEGATLSRETDGSLLASGPRPDRDSYVITFTSPVDRVTAIQLEVLPHDSLPKSGPGRQDNGNLHLSEVQVQVFTDQAPQGRVVPIKTAVASFNQDGWAIDRAIDGKPDTAWGIYPQVGAAHTAVFELAEPVALPTGARMTVVLRQLHGGGHLIGRLRLSVTSDPADRAKPIPQAVQVALRVAEAERTDDDRLTIAAYALAETARAELSRLPQKNLVFAAGALVSVINGTATHPTANRAVPKVVNRLHRGDFDKPREVASPGALASLTHAPGRFSLKSPDDERERRAALADWLAHPDNPLTWRSAVNRVWQHHFGRGLCDTPSDFGRMGGLPSHPELLDWLAVTFRDDFGGQLKPLHRMIVLSETYRQASDGREDASGIDGDNRLLWRRNRSRLDADAMRDYTLTLAGTLDLTTGGPGIRHFATGPGIQVTPTVTYSGFDWNAPGVSRRAIYRFVWRGIPDPFLESLDFPDLGMLSPVRGFSASSLQALSLFNDDFVLHHARKLAERLEREANTTPARVDRAVQLAWQRPPTESERTALVGLVEQHGLEALARLLLNSNEFLFLD